MGRSDRSLRAPARAGRRRQVRSAREDRGHRAAIHVRHRARVRRARSSARAGQPARQRDRRARDVAPSRQRSAAPRPRRRDARAGLPKARPTSRSSWPRSRRASSPARIPTSARPLLKRLANLKEEQTEDYKGALETIAKLLHEDATDESTWAELERLAKVAGAEGRLAEIYAAELDGISSDETATAKLARRTGELFAKLGNTERALHFLRRAHQFEPESVELFDAIDALLVKDDRPKERVELYRAALDYRYDPAARTATLHTIADLERTALSDPDAPSTPTARRSTSTTRTAARSTSSPRSTASAGAFRISPSSSSAAPRPPRAPRPAPDSASALARLHKGELGDVERRDRSDRADRRKVRPTTPTPSPSSRRSPRSTSTRPASSRSCGRSTSEPTTGVTSSP